jgi:hypothetical protein
MAFAQMEPFGGAVDDLRAGIGPAVAVNMNRAEGAKPIAAWAFFPWHEPQSKAEAETKPETPDEIANRWRALLTSKGKTDGNV